MSNDSRTGGRNRKRKISSQQETSVCTSRMDNLNMPASNGCCMNIDDRAAAAAAAVESAAAATVAVDGAKRSRSNKCNTTDKNDDFDDNEDNTTGGYSGDCSSSGESWSSSNMDKIGLVIEITKQLDDNSSSKSSAYSSSGSGVGTKKRKHASIGIDGSHHHRRRTDDRSREDRRHKHRHHRRRRLDKNYSTLYSIRNAAFPHSWLEYHCRPKPSPIHPDIDPSLTTLVKNGFGHSGAAAASTARGGCGMTTESDSEVAEHSHDGERQIEKLLQLELEKEQLQKQQQCVSDSLRAISDVLQTYLEAVEKHPSSSSERDYTDAICVVSRSTTKPKSLAAETTIDKIMLSPNPTNTSTKSNDRNHQILTTDMRKRPSLSIPSESVPPPGVTRYNCTNNNHPAQSAINRQKSYEHHRQQPNLISDAVTYSDEAVSLEHALDLSDAPRLLLEANPPHRIIHANAAFSKLIILDTRKKTKKITTVTTKQESYSSTGTTTHDWIQKQNSPPSIDDPGDLRPSSTTKLNRAAVEWKNRSLQDAIEQMIPEELWAASSSTQYVFTCHPVRVPPMMRSIFETESSASSSSSGSANVSPASSSAAVVTDDVPLSKSAEMNGGHISHYLIEGTIPDYSTGKYSKATSGMLATSSTTTAAATASASKSMPSSSKNVTETNTYNLHSRAVG